MTAGAGAGTGGIDAATAGTAASVTAGVGADELVGIVCTAAGAGARVIARGGEDEDATAGATAGATTGATMGATAGATTRAGDGAAATATVRIFTGIDGR